jgi:hypothetical protein
MRITRFSPPGNISDFGTSDQLARRWSDQISGHFTTGEERVQGFLDANGGGARQFYNPLTNPIDAPDETQAVISWNGFPKRFVGQPGQPVNFAGAEPSPPPAGVARRQDEYLEWWVERDAAGKMVSVQFTCEGWDYWQFLAREAPDQVLSLYRQHISPNVQRQELFTNGQYNILNVWNTARGAMHLTHNANNLFAEIILASDASVRRQRNGQEVTAAQPLIECAEFGAPNRNSDPKIGVEVNQLARQGATITIANPVGLYISGIDETGWRLADGTAVQGVFRVLRGEPGLILRAECRLPQNLAAQGATLSDVRIGGTPLRFGGQIAQRITMKIVGSACRLGTIQNPLAPCGPIPDVPGFVAASAPPKRSEN